MSLHIKGRILQRLNEFPSLWDYQIADMVLKEYGLSGDYWKGTVRVTLADLYSCGLIESIEEAIDDGTHFGCDKLLFNFRLTEFGKSRMRDTSLL